VRRFCFSCHLAGFKSILSIDEKSRCDEGQVESDENVKTFARESAALVASTVAPTSSEASAL
jgi:hypothetical protein